VFRGERVGLIKFGSRVDLFLDRSASAQVRVGDHVKGGASVLAQLATAPPLVASEVAHSAQGER